MCGIAGYCGAEIAGVLERMAECLRHRGPERGGFYHDGAAHFAHRRLSIVDLSVAADQPLTTADGALTVVFNGEIYNHQILRRDLETRGHRFVTDHSDTEVLLHGYREWGAALPEKLDGFWAFVIYDRAAQRIFGSRDRFGKKPFFYAASGADFVFASELTALRAHPALRFSPDPLSLQKYFGYGFIPAPRTIFADIYQLPAGHNFVYEIATGAVRVSEYWDYVIEPQEFTPAQESAKCEELRELLRGAVEKRLRADVPVGILLSGGVDSSSVAALAAQARGEVSTFSIGFAERDFDESPYAAQVAEAIHSKHHLTTMTEREMLGALPILAQIDQPFADDSLLPTYLVCREARKKVTVALGGDGGDELFAGYEPFRYWQWARRLQIYLPKFAPRALAALASLLPAAQGYLSPSLKIKKFFRAAARPLRVWVPSLLAPLAPEEIAELLDAPAPLDEIYAEAIAVWNKCPSADPADKITAYYVKLYLADQLLVKADRASMLNSLELRSPYLDRDVADFARRLPSRYRVKNGIWGGGVTKYLLKKALAPILPHDILYRKKQGFSPPTARWWRNGDLQLPAAPRFGKVEFMQRALASHRAGRDNQTLYLWAQLALEKFSATV